MAKKKPVEISAEAIAAAKKSKRTWTYTWVSIAAVGALAIGGAVYYGLVEQPKINHEKDVKACTIFNDALGKAQGAQSYEAYFDAIFVGANDALAEATKGSDLRQTLYDLAIMRFQITAENGAIGAQVVDQGATLVQARCADVLQVQVPDATPTN